MIPPPMNDMESNNAMPSICDSCQMNVNQADMTDAFCRHIALENVNAASEQKCLPLPKTI
jgi:hypothetical protein